MDISKKLMQKNGIMAMELAKDFMVMEVGDRISTVAQLSEQYQTARGTIQSAIKILDDYKAIGLEPRGHLGTFITHIDHVKLLEIAGVKSIVGVMPLPYSKKYEGLATGIYNGLDNVNIPINLAFMRGSNNRLKALKDNRYDFAITSRLTAEHYVRNHENVKVIMGFGIGSYVNEHILILRSNDFYHIPEGMRIGIDYSSIDQMVLTQKYFKDKKVEYIPISYNQITESLNNGTIDGAIWNIDDIRERKVSVLYKELDNRDYNYSDTEAVIITNSNNNMIDKLFTKLINRDKVIEYQKKVINGVMMPNY